MHVLRMMLSTIPSALAPSLPPSVRPSHLTLSPAASATSIHPSLSLSLYIHPLSSSLPPLHSFFNHGEEHYKLRVGQCQPPDATP